MSNFRDRDRRIYERRSEAPRPPRDDQEQRRDERRTYRLERRESRDAVRATEQEIQSLMREAEAHPGGIGAFFDEEIQQAYKDL